MLKTLEESNKEVFKRAPQEGKKKNGVACPKCGHELQDVVGALLMSSPPQIRTCCSECDYKGTRFV